MRETQALIERVRRVSADVQQVDLAVDPALMQLKPGQALFVRRHDQPGWEPYLRELWIPADMHPGRLTVEITSSLDVAPNEIVDVLSPVGRPIPVRPRIQHLLLIADDALPTPFVFLARTLSGGGVAITLVLNGLAARYPLELLSPEVEIVRGDADWSWPDQVATFQWADQVLILAPGYRQADAYGRLLDRLRQIRTHDLPDHYACGLFYDRLACGAGACGACEVRAHDTPLLACTDGPAIDLKRVVFR
ncbi:MAG: hypothetical protein M5U29_18805 [Anaerolineae bacterium]|nr:hypothetical protein [Anaerolineae bacterium]